MICFLRVRAFLQPPCGGTSKCYICFSTSMSSARTRHPSLLLCPLLHSSPFLHSHTAPGLHSKAVLAKFSLPTLLAWAGRELKRSRESAVICAKPPSQLREFVGWGCPLVGLGSSASRMQMVVYIGYCFGSAGPAKELFATHRLIMYIYIYI